MIEEFRSVAPQADLDDLAARLRMTRWADIPTDEGWAPGVDVRVLRDLVEYWRDEFDWRAQEATLNSLPRFRTEVDGLGIHFVHARSARPGAVPLILTHGWPDSFWRYTKVIPLLAETFDVIVPDIPGFGYSDKPHGPALASPEVAALWAGLMTQLGYEKFLAAGGDLGSHVSRYLALDFPDRVIAVHRMDAGLPIYDGDTAALSAAERAWFDRVAGWGATEGAYAAIHRTKPHTQAAALADSPVGLAAWIVEKLHSWSDGGLHAYSNDEILTNVMIYWLTNSIGTSMRMYRANAAIPIARVNERVEVPSGFSLFAGDIVRPPREWVHRMANAVSITEPDRGGHFAPFEQPELYAHELRDFFARFPAGHG